MLRVSVVPKHFQVNKSCWLQRLLVDFLGNILRGISAGARSPGLLLQQALSPTTELLPSSQDMMFHWKKIVILFYKATTSLGSHPAVLLHDAPTDFSLHTTLILHWDALAFRLHLLYFFWPTLWWDAVKRSFPGTKEGDWWQEVLVHPAVNFQGPFPFPSVVQQGNLASSSPFNKVITATFRFKVSQRWKFLIISSYHAIRRCTAIPGR